MSGGTHQEEGTGGVSVDCQVFADQLDALVRGALPEEGVRQLRLHAGTCADCATLLKVQEHLVHPSLEDLESRVPEEVVAGMWEAVREDLSSRQAGPGESAAAIPGEASLAPNHPRLQPRPRWLVPALAAATLALLFSTGFLYWQTTELQSRAAVLAQQVEDQRHWMAELDADAADPVARTAALAGRNPWSRALSRQDQISLADLRDLLARAPGNRVILSQAQLDAVLRSRMPLSPPILRDAMGRIQGTDGVTAAELLAALDGLDASPDTTLPTEELMALFS